MEFLHYSISTCFIIGMAMLLYGAWRTFQCEEQSRTEHGSNPYINHTQLAPHQEKYRTITIIGAIVTTIALVCSFIFAP
jgi:hypothetical protein